MEDGMPLFWGRWDKYPADFLACRWNKCQYYCLKFQQALLQRNSDVTKLAWRVLWWAALWKHSSGFRMCSVCCTHWNALTVMRQNSHSWLHWGIDLYQDSLGFRSNQGCLCTRQNSENRKLRKPFRATIYRKTSSQGWLDSHFHLHDTLCMPKNKVSHPLGQLLQSRRTIPGNGYNLLVKD